jgi:hypothetical protein
MVVTHGVSHLPLAAATGVKIGGQVGVYRRGGACNGLSRIKICRFTAWASIGGVLAQNIQCSSSDISQECFTGLKPQT